MLALGGHDYPRTHDLGLLLDLLASVDVCIPEVLLTVENLTPFATVFRYDDLPLYVSIDRQEWLPILWRWSISSAGPSRRRRIH